MTDKRFIDTGGGNYTESIKGNYYEYNAPAKPQSEIKSELSEKIANSRNKANRIELEVEKIRAKLLSYLPFDQAIDFTCGDKKIESDIDWFLAYTPLIKAGEIKLFFEDNLGVKVLNQQLQKAEYIKALRDEYKHKIYELNSQLKHLSNLENELRILCCKEIVNEVVFIVEKLRY